LAFSLAIALPLSGIAADRTDATSLTSATAPYSPNLKRLFDGGKLEGLADLKAMQSHVRSLADEVKKSTVVVQVSSAWGSGVIISKDGYVLTAAHVAGQPNRERNVFVTLHDGREVKAKTLGLFRTLDAGLMKITEEGEYPYAPLGDSTLV